MACILSIVGISDLHPENVILKGAKLENDKVILGDTFDIVPVDLEVFMPNTISYLLNISATENVEKLRAIELDYPLSDGSKLCIGECEKLLPNISCRVLPMDTEELSRSLCYYPNCERLSQGIAQVFLGQGYLVDYEKLKKCIMIDMLNSDVSFFTKKVDILYHGFNEQIGSKK